MRSVDGHINPIFHMKAKTARKIVLRLEYKKFRTKKHLTLKRTKHFKFGMGLDQSCCIGTIMFQYSLMIRKQWASLNGLRYCYRHSWESAWLCSRDACEVTPLVDRVGTRPDSPGGTPLRGKQASQGRCNERILWGV
ncbi:hypothetical protein ACHAWF_000288 [Thalassiosira exigua]